MNGKTIGDDAVQFERLMPARIDVVWEYLTVPERIATWLAIAQIEPRAGGSARLEWEDWSTDDPPPNGEKHWVATGKVLLWNPPNALTYTWNQPGLPESELAFELTQRGEETLLVLTHRLLVKDRHMFAAGWHAHLDLLATRLEGGERGDFIGEFKKLLPRYAASI